MKAVILKMRKFVLKKLIKSIENIFNIRIVSLEEISIPKLVTTIGSYAFKKSSIETITISEKVKTIEEVAKWIYDDARYAPTLYLMRPFVPRILPSLIAVL